MESKRLYLIRHGATDTQIGGETSGSSDLPLNNIGIAQIHRLLKCLDDTRPNVIYSSPLKRAKQTAEIISSHFECQIVEIPEIREIDIGNWDGMPLPKIKKRYPEEYKEWIYSPRNGESLDMLLSRVSNSIMKLLDNDQNGMDIYCVTHGGPIRVSLIKALDIPIDNYWKIKIPHGSISKFEYCEQQLIPCYIGLFVK